MLYCVVREPTRVYQLVLATVRHSENGGDRGGSSKGTPLVSIGLPVYNGERYLEQSLRSLLAQTFADFEIIVGDNGSTDRTPQIVASLAAQDSRVRYVRNCKNRGLVFNFNRVFELSQGHYFRWHAYDDFCKPRFLEQCVAALQEDEEAIGAFSLGYQVDGNDDVVTRDVDESLKLDLSSSKPADRMRAAITRNGWSGVIHGLFLRDALAPLMPYRNYFGADRLLLTQLAKSGRMVPVDDGIWIQRYHRNNSSRASTRELAEILIGRPPSGIIFPIGKAFVDYIRLFASEGLSLADRIKAFGYLLRHGIRRDVVYNLIVPGPHNYFGFDLGRKPDDSSTVSDSGYVSHLTVDPHPS